MAIDRQAIVNRQKKEIQDYLSAYPSNAYNLYGDASNIINRNQDDLLSAYKAKIGQYGNEYNINPRRVDVLAQSQFAPKLEQQRAQSRQNVEQAKYQAIRENYNRVYNYAVDNLLQQGIDLQTAEQQARSVADNWQEQQFQAEQAQTKREQYTKKSDIANRYQQSQTMLENQFDQDALQNQIQQAFQRQLFGLAGTAGVGYFTGAFGERYKPANSGTTFTNPLQSVQLPKNLNWRQY